MGFFVYKHKALQIGNKNMRIVLLVVVSFAHQLLKYSCLCSAIIKLYYKVEVFLEKLFNFKRLMFYFLRVTDFEAQASLCLY